MKKYLFTILLVLSSFAAEAQFGYGMSLSMDLYNRYSNPSDDISSPSSGSTLLNFGVGPKIWLGIKKMSVSVEARANLGLLALSTKDYKGLGAVSFPLIARLNFGGLSGLDMKGQWGFSLGGGIQYNKTELYYLSSSYRDKGVTRDLFQTYVFELAFGYGINGSILQFVTRYGYHPDNDANSLNIGLQADFNLNLLKKIDKPQSRLF